MNTQRAPATLDDVRLEILRQHTQIAQLTDELETHAAAVVASGGHHRALASALNAALDRLSSQFARHLDYEETHSDVAPLGDHTDQRCRLQGLLHDREVFGDLCTVAREALAFAHQLRSDIAAEDGKVRGLR